MFFTAQDRRTLEDCHKGLTSLFEHVRLLRVQLDQRKEPAKPGRKPKAPDAIPELDAIDSRA